jgi:hypothetical protein
MNGVFVKNWRVSSIPGGIQLSTRQVYDGNLLIEEIVLEASPLTLARADRVTTYPARRRK